MASLLPREPDFGSPCPIQPSQETLQVLALRRSSSAATLRAPGPDADQLADLLRLAARAPDHGKLFPWRFIVLEGEGKSAFAERLRDVARAGGHPEGALMKLTAPPLAVAVISSPKPGKIPEWEQILSAAAVCQTMLVAAEAMGFGANWITDWYAYDPAAKTALGLTGEEQVAGFIYLGTPSEPPLERVRPDVAEITTRWTA